MTLTLSGMATLGTGFLLIFLPYIIVIMPLYNCYNAGDSLWLFSVFSYLFPFLYVSCLFCCYLYMPPSFSLLTQKNQMFMLVFCWGCLQLCSLETSPRNIYFLFYCLLLALVSEYYWSHKMSLEVLPHPQVFGRFVKDCCSSVNVR